MNGKKIIAMMAAVALTIALVGTAMAATIAPNPGKISMDDLAGRYITTNIEYKGDGMVTLTLLENEQFDGEAIKALQVGDVITSNGGDITVESISWDGPDLFINQGTADEALLSEAGNGLYERYMENDAVPQLTIGTMEWEVKPYVTMLDWVDPITGETLEELAVRDGDGLLELLEKGDGPSFAVENVHIVYDDNAQPMLIWRFYSPAQ